MAELSDVLGTLLRDLARARVVSDHFSAEVSHVYEQDPLLSIFPVPRAEIREATIGLKFTINAVEKRPVDRLAAGRALVVRYSNQIADEVFTAVVERHPNASAILGSLETRQVDLKQRLDAAAETGMLGDPGALEAILGGDPEPLAKRVQASVAGALLDDSKLKPLLVARGMRVGTINQTLRQIVAAAAARLAPELSTTVAIANQQAFALEVGVTPKELAGIPETLFSQVSLVAQIRNYEWVEVGDADGAPVKRLRPE